MMVQLELAWRKEIGGREKGERENYSEKNPQAMDGMNGGESLHAMYGNNIIFMKMW